MAFVVLARQSGALYGVTRLSSDPDHELLVRSDLQGHGLGWAVLHRLLDYARADGLKRIEGFVLHENAKMLKMCRETGFHLTPDPDDARMVRTSLDLAVSGP
jgi:acetyltransferase